MPQRKDKVQFQQVTVVANPAAGANPAWRTFANPKPASPTTLADGECIDAVAGEVVRRDSPYSDSDFSGDDESPHGEVDSPQTYEEVRSGVA